MEKVTIYGVGYVGLVTGICLAKLGRIVCCMDIDNQKINALKKGEVTIYEPVLSDLLQEALQENRIIFTTDVKTAIHFSPIQMIAVGTPPKPNGQADLSQVDSVISSIGQYSHENKFIIIKSTVPVGTADRVTCTMQKALDKRGSQCKFDVASNPEFLREGAAVKDFLEPDRIIIGVNNKRSEEIFRELYKPLLECGYPLVSMDIHSSELTKYVANAFLATKISFINDVSQLAEKLGANIHQIKRGLITDARISEQFLNAGCGFGGSCFPKDLLALQSMAKDQNFEFYTINAALQTNTRHQRLLFDKIMEYFSNDIKGKVFALWGLAFKPNTDDVRFASSRVVMELLWEHGAFVQAYDPIAMVKIKTIYGNKSGFRLCKTAKDALLSADALVVLTEWQEFHDFNINLIKSALKKPIIFDGRNIYDLEIMTKEKIKYFGVGCAVLSPTAESNIPVSESNMRKSSDYYGLPEDPLVETASSNLD